MFYSTDSKNSNDRYGTVSMEKPGNTISANAARRKGTGYFVKLSKFKININT
jgi:hypothetical protein